MAQKYAYSEITCRHNITNAEIVYYKEFDGLIFSVDGLHITIYHHSDTIVFYSKPVCAALYNYSIIKTKPIEIKSW